MLRLGILLLLLLNTLYFAWGNGWLLGLGWGPVPQAEPQRLGLQINPQALSLVNEPANPVATPGTSNPSAVPDTRCLQSPPLSPREAQALRALLPTTLPQTSWTLNATPGSQRWLIYMGKFESPADVTKKRAQLTALGVKLYPLGNAALAPGVSLGAYPTAEAAQTALEELKPMGVRTARIIEDLLPSASYLLRLPAVDAALQASLPALQAALGDKVLVPCTAAPATPP
jgi:hypothetical protein